MMTKRKLEQEHELEVSEINNEVSSATVHGVLVELSPIKKSRKNDVEYVVSEDSICSRDLLSCASLAVLCSSVSDDTLC